MYVEPAEVKTILAGINSNNDDDYQGTAAELDDEIIAMHIVDAEAQVNASLKAKYPVPFTSDVPELIKSITRNFAAYFADMTFRKSRAYDSNNYPAIRRYNWALDQLERLRTGRLSIKFDESDEAEIFHVYEGPLFIQSHYLGPDNRDRYVVWDLL